MYLHNNVSFAYNQIALLLQHQGEHVKVINSHNKQVDTIELEHFVTCFKGNYQNLVSSHIRNCTTKTCFSEFLWYMTGQLNVESVLKYLPNWGKFTNNEHGAVASNYGYYWLRDFDYIIAQLSSDVHSRRAVVSIYDSTKVKEYKKDTPCTLNIVFKIRNNRLNMSVTMRSNDFWYGFPIDQFCNSMLWELVYNELLLTNPSLQLGHYRHYTESMHAYTDQCPMTLLKEIANEPVYDESFHLPKHITRHNFWQEASSLFPKEIFEHFRNYANVESCISSNKYINS